MKKTVVRIEQVFCDRCKKEYVAKEFEDDKLISWQRCPFHDPSEMAMPSFKSFIGAAAKFRKRPQ